METELEALIRRGSFRIHHLGVRDSALRIVLAGRDGRPSHVVELDGVRSQYVKPYSGKEEVLVTYGGVGPFGFWVESSDEHRQVEVRSKSRDGEVLMYFIAREIAFRACDDGGLDINYPG
jgi:hypothetical protein